VAPLILGKKKKKEMTDGRKAGRASDPLTLRFGFAIAHPWPVGGEGHSLIWAI